MFDSTGVLEVFCSRFDSQECHPNYPCSPSHARHEEDRPPPAITQDRFMVSVFLMERFDWMGQDVASMRFSLDEGPAQHVEYVDRPGCSNMPPRLRAEDEMQFYDGCFAGQRRIALRSAELHPANSDGWPLVMQERDARHIVVSLQRGRKVVKHGDSDQQATYFETALGAAGFTTTIVFSYDSTYHGIVHMLSTMTYTRTKLPRLELTREMHVNERKRARESSEGTQDDDDDGDTNNVTRPAKAARRARSDALETEGNGTGI